MINKLVFQVTKYRINIQKSIPFTIAFKENKFIKRRINLSKEA